MFFALLAMDLVWGLGLVLVATPASFAAFAVFERVAAFTGEPALGFVAACVAFVAVYVADVCVVLRLLPRPRPGRHTLLRGRDFYVWSLRFIARRWLDVPPISILVRQSSIARTLMLRAAGARVSFLANMSANVVLLDPDQLEVDASSILGSNVCVAGHMVVDGTLTIGRVHIAEGAELGLDAAVGPGSRVGRRATLQPGAMVGPFCEIGEGAVIGMRATLGARVVVGEGARVAAAAFVPNGTVIAPGEVFEAR